MRVRTPMASSNGAALKRACRRICACLHRWDSLHRTSSKSWLRLTGLRRLYPRFLSKMGRAVPECVARVFCWPKPIAQARESWNRSREPQDEKTDKSRLAGARLFARLGHAARADHCGTNNAKSLGRAHGRSSQGALVTFVASLIDAQGPPLTFFVKPFRVLRSEYKKPLVSERIVIIHPAPYEYLQFSRL